MRDREAVEGAGKATVGGFGVELCGTLAGLVDRQSDNGVNHRIESLDPLEVYVENLARRQFFAPHSPDEFRRAKEVHAIRYTLD
jgi:hypothetical protein